VATEAKKVLVRDQVEISVEGGIVHVAYLDGADITPEIKHEMHLAFLQLTAGRKMPFIFESKGALWYSREAREYARELEPKQPFLAVAMIAPGLGFRLLAEFYARIYKPERPYKVFKTKAEAESWLAMFSEN
jgi:hypothetical protein